MTVPELLVLLAVAGLVGGIGQSLSGYSHGGCLSSIAVGFIGALLGNWLSRGLGLPEIFTLTIGSVAMPIVWAIAGAALFVSLVGFLGSNRKRRFHRT